jgi:hypothetical protein
MHFLMILLSGAILATSLDAREKVTFRSQANQDEFVVTLLCDLLGKKDSGYYLEVGAGDPVDINNTYVLEKNYGWRGISIDISSKLSHWHSVRNNPLLLADAIQLDYCSILEDFPQVIDYLSLDIDGYYDEVLRKVMLLEHVFRVITIEHNTYRYGDIYRNKEREILAELGYHLLCADVSFQGNSFEDWWIHPAFFPPSLFQQLTSHHLQGKESAEIMQHIKNLSHKILE